MDDTRERYFSWLCDQVAPQKGAPGHNDYHRLFKILHEKKFYSLIPHDENRSADALNLRTEYAYDTGMHMPVDIVLSDEPSVLEVLIALSGQIVKSMDDIVRPNNTERWFWEMIGNLGLDKFTDAELERRTDQFYLVDDIIERFLAREYTATGVGGLFPLWKKGLDERKMEIWEQCQQYLYERYCKDILW